MDQNDYKYITANVKKPVFSHQQLKLEGYYSQYGQDKWIIENFFPALEKGTFVDIGAHDGITLSNTYLLEKMGWTGIAVEPIPSIYEKLISNRKCITINGCIAPKSGKERFRLITGYPEMLSGLANEYDLRHLDRIQAELNFYGGDYTDIEVDCYKFNELLEGYGISWVDYLSIDVEGIEYKILESIDFDRIHISVIGVENNYSDYRIHKLLTEQGFVFHSIVGQDEFYRLTLERRANRDEISSLIVGLKEINLIAWPDWSQPGERVAEQLAQAIKGLAHHPDRQNIALLIGVNHLSPEDANLILCEVLLNLTLEDAQLPIEDLNIALMDQLSGSEWLALRSRLDYRLALPVQDWPELSRRNLGSLPEFPLPQV